MMVMRMLNLSDRKWKAFNIVSLFDKIEAGKISNASYFEKTDIGGIEYIAATNRNNGCLYFLKDTDDSRKKLQRGNCIGFIKDGNGSAGYAIYKSEDFASTVNVIYGYANWLNKYTGLFFVTAQDMIAEKYSHGYKRNKEHLSADKVMLPVDEQDEPDYQFMEEYIKEREMVKRKEYVCYCEAQLKILGGVDKISITPIKDWKPFFIIDIFDKDNIKRGKRLTKANQKQGLMPYVSSSASNNGVDNFIEVDNKKMRIFSNCLSIANSGSVGSSFYEPFEFVASDHVTHLENPNFNKYIYLFIATMTNRWADKYNFNREINEPRMMREKVLLPINDSGEPDYEYMEQYSKNLMYMKYKQYLDYLDKKSVCHFSNLLLRLYK